MNGFEKHGIDHSSASSINMYMQAPCAWVAKYILKEKFSFGLAAKAGVLVEDAVVNIIANGWDAQKAIDAAVAEYNRASAFGASDAERTRGEGISGMITGAIEELKQYGTPEFDIDFVHGKKQKRIELLCNGDGWKLPVVGFLDFYFPQHGVVVDLKTTMRAPSNMSDEHIRQGAIYRHASGNMAVRFLYATPKKTIWHEVPEVAPILSEIKTILNRQEKMLRLSDETIRDIVPVIPGSFYWNGDVKLRQRIYGI